MMLTSLLSRNFSVLVGSTRAYELEEDSGPRKALSAVFRFDLISMLAVLVLRALFSRFFVCRCTGCSFSIFGTFGLVLEVKLGGFSLCDSFVNEPGVSFRKADLAFALADFFEDFADFFAFALLADSLSDSEISLSAQLAKTKTTIARKRKGSKVVKHQLGSLPREEAKL